MSHIGKYGSFLLYKYEHLFDFSRFLHKQTFVHIYFFAFKSLFARKSYILLIVYKVGLRGIQT